MTTVITTLKEQYMQLKADNPKLRIRDAAKQLNTNEAQLVALGVGENVTRLEGDWKELLVDVKSLGKVMALTRNDDAVHERKGIYDNISFNGLVGVAVNPDIDLRFFMMNWDTGFSVSEGERKSLQFFDKSGDAVHKIYMTDMSDETAYQALVKKYTASEQKQEIATTPYPPTPDEKPDNLIDIESFRNSWENMKDTHQFFGIVKEHGLSRLQALRLAPEGFVKKVDNNISRKILDTAGERQIPIMVFVGNRGCIQIHSGEVKKMMEAGPWYNVLDSDFNLHLRETAITHTYVVKKPTTDGIVTAVEVYDNKGEMIVQFFGVRKPGVPELETWRSLVSDVTNF